MSQLSNDLKWTTATAVVLALASTVMTSADVRHRDAAAAFPVAYTDAQPSQVSQRITYDSCYAFASEYLCDVAYTASQGVQPKWSPDGTRIAFVGGTPDNTLDLFVVSLDSGVITNVTQDLGSIGGPAWSRDGTKIAFVSSSSGSTELYLANADGSGVVRLTDAIGFTGGFAWSPDGRLIALSLASASGWDLYTMHADGSNLVRLTVGGVVGGSGISWVPDGSRILFDGVGEVWAINADGTGLVQLTTGSGVGGVLAPIGGSLAFSTARFGTGFEIAVARADGTIVRVAPNTPGTGPVWSPDGASLVFQGTAFIARSGVCYPPGSGNNADEFCIHRNGIYSVNADGTNLQLFALGNNPDLFILRAGQPVAAFTHACTGSSCTFDASGSVDPEGAIVSYKWQFGDGASATGATPSHTYSIGRTYAVTLTIVDGEGLQSTTTRMVVANAPPVASFTGTCDGPVCTFDASASSDPDGPIINYWWILGDGTFAPQGVPTVTHTYRSGTFLVRLFVSDSGGAQAGAELTISIVNAVPIANFTVGCVLLTCTFDASASSDDGPIVYRWAFGDNREASDKIATHTYFAGGTYLARLTVTDNAGQTATATQTVTAIAPLGLHVGNLDGSATNLQNRWNASLTIEIHREDHQALGGATVNGYWSDGTPAACATDSTGRCVLSRNDLPNRTTAVTFTVTGVSHPAHAYKPVGNHDPDGSSNGTSITIRRR